MQKITLLLVFVFITVNGLLAQSDKLSFGIKGGLNLATIQRGDYYINDGKMRYLPTGNLGAFARYKLTDHLSLRGGLEVMGTGYRYTERNAQLGKWIHKLHLINLNIPVSVIYDIRKFYAGVGPSFSYSIAGRWSERFITETASEESDLLKGKVDLKYTNRFNLGANILAGYAITPKIAAEAGYVLGLSHLEKSDNGYKSKPRTFSLSVVYSL